MESAEGVPASFKGMTNFHKLEGAGTVVGVNCRTLDTLKKTDYPERLISLENHCKGA